MFAVATVLLLSPAPVIAGWSSPDFRARDRASAVAAKRYAPHCWGWADLLSNPECQCRAERAKVASVSAAMKRFEPFPSADACWYDPVRLSYRSQAAISGWAMIGLKDRLGWVGTDSYPYANYRLATRLWVLDSLRAGTPESSLKALVDEMRRRDVMYYHKVGHAVPWEK